MMKTVSIIVAGRVQGVFFRQTTRDKAIALGIKGEVKNMDDESVHIIATGSPDKLEELIEWCRQGPARAKVTNVFTQDLPLQSFDKFSIVR